MSWIRRFWIREYIHNSLWVVPFGCVVVAGVTAAILWRLDVGAGWPVLGFKTGGAMAAMQAVMASMITFTAVVFSILLMVVQFASAQLTPRVLRTSFRDPFTKVALGAFAGTAFYSLVIMARITDAFVPQLAMLVGGVFLGFSMLVFLLLIGHMAETLRPGIIVARVGIEGRQTLETVYGPMAPRAREQDPPVGGMPGGNPTRTVRHTGASGLVLAVDAVGLVAEAARCNAVVMLEPALGDFVPTDTPLFHVFETGTGVSDQRLCESVAIGRERTTDQDPAFAFRILVDIAIRGLSPAVNDPTTAVMAIDQIHQLLSCLGRCDLDAGRYRDAAGRMRLEVPMPTWDDYLGLALVEIRQYGATSVQVTRRLRGMLEDLLETVPEGRKPAVRQELELLTRMIQRAFTEPEDRALAQIADFQGIGASRDAAHRVLPPPAGRS